MEPPRTPADASPEAVVTSSPDVFSPGGKSRYGRTRRPKISLDFCNIDDVVMDEDPARKSKLPLKPPIKDHESAFDDQDEFTKLDDLGMRVANNFKTNLHRGLDSTIKERKFFKSMPDNKIDVPNVVDVTKVFKLISKPTVVPEVCEVRTTPKTALKTYSNKRRHLNDGDGFIVESFGLPDEPIIPVNSPFIVERNTKIDVDMSGHVDVNLANPWAFEDFDPVPLYASEPVSTKDEFNFRGGMLHLFSYDSLLGENTELLEPAPSQDYTDFEKSRIPTPEKKIQQTNGKSSSLEIEKRLVDKENVGKDSIDNMFGEISDLFRTVVTTEKIKSKTEKVVANDEFKEVSEFFHAKIASPQPTKIKDVRKITRMKFKKVDKIATTPKKDTSGAPLKVASLKDQKNKKEVIGEVSKRFEKLVPSRTKNAKSNNIFNKITSRKSVPLTESKKLRTEVIKMRNKKLFLTNNSPKRILRSSFDNNNTEPIWIADDSPAPVKNIKIKENRPSQAINKSQKLSICSPQIRVVLNPLSYTHKHLTPPDLVPNFLTMKAQLDNKLLSTKKTLEKKSDGERLPDQTKLVEEEDLEIKDIKKEVVEFQAGDLAWAKIGSHPYWPCLVTTEPVSGEYKRAVVNRSQPLYHVRFFGDRGRRAWVSAQHVMLFFGRDDLHKLAEEMRTKDKAKPSVIRECCRIKSNKLPKWQSGVSEAESLRYKPIQKRLSYFFELFASINEKKAAKKLDKIENVPDDDKMGEDLLQMKVQITEEVLESNVQPQTSNSSRVSKRNRREEREETKCEILIGEEINVIKDEVEDEKVVPMALNKTTRIVASTPKEKLLEKNSTTPSLRSSKNSSPVKQPEITAQDMSQSRKFMKPEVFSDEAIEARKKLRNFRSAPPTPEPVQETTVPEVATPQRPNSSDTDSKFSDNSSVPTSLESQAALFRRNNIFRGIPREKVCQVCEEGGEVFKCKGPCNGVYHQKCAVEGREENVKDEAQSEGKEKEAESNTVEIISVGSRKPLPNLSSSPNFKGMSLAEKIDFRMKEIMKKFDHQTVYSESTDSGSEEFLMDESFEKTQKQSKLALTVTNKPNKKEVPIIKHVTADNISYICVTEEKVTEPIKEIQKNSRCSRCTTRKSAPCLVCHAEESKTGSKFRQKCSLHQCGKFYHSECLKFWPQTQWSFILSAKDKRSDEQHDTFVCPRHVCHTCISDDPRAANSRCSSDKVVKCLRCPATYHSSNYCVPAGTHIVSSSQIVCPRHFTQQTTKKKLQQTINTNWCFICSKGGNLICCETCPTSVHVECLPGDLDEDDTFFCEDCQSGRLPLYDEIVWVKLGTFRWWPALILFPNEIPDNVKNMVHNKGEFVVKFYGTYDHYWVTRGRTFLFQEGDKGHSKSSRKRMDNAFVKAIEEAAASHQLKKQFKMSKVAEKNSVLKPPPYIRIKVNKPVGNVRLYDGNTSNTTSCDCDPNQPHPCGPDSDCLNRLLLTECNPEVCAAGTRCNNQCFEKREYPPLVPYRTQLRGWGLKTLAPIRKGQFVIEYVGELIDEQEYQRRVQKMHEQKEENYYFLTLDKDRTLDAGPKGNVARFMNHSCQPNCETQKWTVNCDTRVGLFAKCDIPADTELTFNYNLECIGKEKKICRCGAPNCNGFIGGKVKQDGAPKRSTKPKKKKTPPPEVVDNENPCFICGKVGDVGACNNKICTKYYHLRCVALKSWPEGRKWTCPWHNCNICSKRTIRCCVKCVNSYCPKHSAGSVRHDKLLGFICFEHDPLKIFNSNASAGEEEATPSTASVANADDPDDHLECMPLAMRLNGVVTSTPLKKSHMKISHEKRRVRKRGLKRKNVANLFNSGEKKIKMSSSTPIRRLRMNMRSNKKKLNGKDPKKDMPIRKRTRLRR